jgi:2-methylcitrate dehydratase PrpD
MPAADLISAQTLDEFARAAAAQKKIVDRVAQDAARSAVADTVACIIAAAEDPVTRVVREAVVSAGAGCCSAIGITVQLSAETAALINGTAAHALDFDDNYLPAVTHASAVLVPTLLALGEESQLSGSDMIDAYVLGLEIQAWFGAKMLPDHYVAGWHATSTIGTIGAAAAGARLLNLPHEEFRNALSIACSMAGGSKVQMGTMTKPLHAGLAARSGVTSAKLAAAGMEASLDPVSEDWGFVSMHHGRKDPVQTQRTEYSIVTDGLAQKRFPCCASAHRSLDAIIQMRDEHKFQPEDITAIETTIPSSNFRNLRFNTPRNEKEARFSMTYCAALAALHGHLNLSDFQPEAIYRPDVQKMMAKITVRDAGPQSDAGSGIWDIPAHTRITLRDGAQFELSMKQPVGTLSAPLSAEDHRRKFEDCVVGKLPREETERLKEMLSNVEDSPVCNLAQVMRSAANPNRDAT